MSSPYQPYNPSTGPNYNPNVYPYNKFTPPGPGTAYYANLSPNLTPDPGPPAPQTDNGILLENSLNSFIEKEDNSGWIVIE